MMPRMNGIQLRHDDVHHASSPSTKGATYRSPGQASLSERRPGLRHPLRKANPSHRHSLPCASSVCNSLRRKPAAWDAQQHR
jgi:hypothetical protein